MPRGGNQLLLEPSVCVCARAHVRVSVFMTGRGRLKVNSLLKRGIFFLPLDRVACLHVPSSSMYSKAPDDRQTFH